MDVTRTEEVLMLLNQQCETSSEQYEEAALASTSESSPLRRVSEAGRCQAQAGRPPKRALAKGSASFTTKADAARDLRVLLGDPEQAVPATRSLRCAAPLKVGDVRWLSTLLRLNLDHWLQALDEQLPKEAFWAG